MMKRMAVLTLVRMDGKGVVQKKSKTHTAVNLVVTNGFFKVVGR